MQEFHSLLNHAKSIILLIAEPALQANCWPAVLTCYCKAAKWSLSMQHHNTMQHPGIRSCQPIRGLHLGKVTCQNCWLSALTAAHALRQEPARSCTGAQQWGSRGASQISTTLCSIINSFQGSCDLLTALARDYSARHASYGSSDNADFPVESPSLVKPGGIDHTAKL